MASIGGKIGRDEATERMRRRAREAIEHSPHAEAALKQRRAAEALQATKERKARQAERSAMRRRDEEREKAMGDEDLSSSFLSQVPGPHGEGAEYIEEMQDTAQKERLEAQRERLYPWEDSSPPIGLRDIFSGPGTTARKGVRDREEAKKVAQLKETIFGSNPNDPETRVHPQPGTGLYGSGAVPPHPRWKRHYGNWYDEFSTSLGRNLANMPGEAQSKLLGELEEAEADLLGRMAYQPWIGSSRNAPGKPMKPLLYGVARKVARKLSPTHIPAARALRRWEEGSPEEFDGYLNELARVRAYRQVLIDQTPVQVKRELEDWRGGDFNRKMMDRAMMKRLAGKRGKE
tara:strand:+ start:4125 stop:5162 length:1038 start_codon:yes stop_codon:yes gene_type:complete